MSHAPKPKTTKRRSPADRLRRAMAVTNTQAPKPEQDTSDPFVQALLRRGIISAPEQEPAEPHWSEKFIEASQPPAPTKVNPNPIPLNGQRVLDAAVRGLSGASAPSVRSTASILSDHLGGRYDHAG